jgi:molecular chaperone GrpE
LDPQRERADEAAAGGRDANPATLQDGGPAAAPGVQPEAPGDEPGAPLSELELLQASYAQLEDRHLRLAAEYDNFRKRSAREWREHQQRAAAEVLREMLELADNLERALAAPGDDVGGLRKGVALIAQQLQAKLRRFGVEPIETEGQEFDPTRHEAVLVVDSDTIESQRVVDTVQRGYTLHGEVLRPARVTVAR